MDDDFVEIKISLRNLDRFYIRKSIIEALKNQLHLFSGSLLDIGCGKMPYKHFILNNSKVTNYCGLDIENAIVYDSKVKPDFTWNGIRMPFDDNMFDCAMGTEVLEHCPNPEIILSEAYRVLKPGGLFFFTIPFLWPLHEVPHDEFRYTPFSIKRILESTGFENITLKATGGWHASMAQMMGLWVKRAPFRNFTKTIISFIFYPFIKKLIKMDTGLKIDFTEGQMITGIQGIARKKI